MLEAGETAHVVKVTRADPSFPGGEFVMLYAVLTDTAQSAVEAVRGVVGTGEAVEPTGGALSAETVKRLGLCYGQTLLL
jgi:hypothetical protein